MCVRRRGKVTKFKLLIPRRDMQSISSRCPIVFTYTLFGLGKILTFGFIGGNPPFWNHENVYPPKGLCESRLQGGPIVFTYTLFRLGSVYDTFNLALVIRLFEILKMLYPPEGLCGAEPERGPIVFTLHFIGVGRGTGGFKFWAGNSPFWKVENV